MRRAVLALAFLVGCRENRKPNDAPPAEVTVTAVSPTAEVATIPPAPSETSLRVPAAPCLRQDVEREPFFVLALQGGRVILPGVADSTVTRVAGTTLPALHVARAPFALVVCMRERGAVLVHASKDRAVAESIVRKRVDPELFIGARAMAEYDGNPDRELWLSEDSLSYWYREPTEGRFDGEIVGRDTWAGVRTVHKLRRFDPDEETPLAQVSPGTSVYLSFAFPESPVRSLVLVLE
ncbi:MAG: hypothetical protein U0271_20085 [Polyangiaceae bacterium]